MSVHPIPFETLVALWAGDLAPEAAEPIEAHLFACDACADASERLGQLLGGLQRAIPPVLSRTFKERLVAQGLHIKELSIEQPTGTEAVFTPDLDVYVFALRADVAGAERVDVEVTDAAGTPHMQLLAVPFDVSRGEVLIACQRHFRSERERDDVVFTLFAHHAGQRREIGSFTITHIWS